MYNKNSKIIIAQNKNAIISDYQSGMTSREVGSKYNISNASVLKILKNNKGIIGIRKIILYLILSGTITVGFLSSVS